MAQKEDVHFLLDNANPLEVEYILRSLDPNVVFSTQELRKRLISDWGYSAQKDMNYSTRRLCDLRLAEKTRTASKNVGYVITERGTQVRRILDFDRDLYAEVMHFLHYTSYDGSPSSRKLFWSYRTCCEIVWARKEILPASDLVSKVLNGIEHEFPQAYALTTEAGGRFNAGGVSNWKAWVTQLQPSPFDEKALMPRHSHRFELTVLALDHVYRSRGYRYGDPVILDELLLDEIARVSFLDPICCRELIDLAARLTKAVKLSDTFTGTSVTLLGPYGVESL